MGGCLDPLFYRPRQERYWEVGLLVGDGASCWSLSRSPLAWLLAVQLMSVCVLLVVFPGEGAQAVCGARALSMGTVQGSQEAESVGHMSIPGDPGRRDADTTSVIPQSRGLKWG